MGSGVYLLRNFLSCLVSCPVRRREAFWEVIVKTPAFDMVNLKLSGSGVAGVVMVAICSGVGLEGADIGVVWRQPMLSSHSSISLSSQATVRGPSFFCLGKVASSILL